MIESTFLQVAMVLAVAAVIGVLAVVMRQPLVVAFIAVGILVGPAAFGLVEIGSELDLLGKLGIAVLLFLVGLKLDPQLVRTTGPVALATGLGQVAFTSIVGFFIAVALGLDLVSAAYVAVALTFSSTIIIVKLLSDKKELEELHGRIAVGFLIVQDIVVIIALIVINAIGEAGTADVGGRVSLLLLRGGAFLVVMLVLARRVLPFLLGRIARNRELLVLFGVAWAVAVAGTAEELGLSLEVGAFLAGFSLAATPYREAIASRLVSLRDFLLLFFFIDLGARLELQHVGDRLGEALVLSFFVLIGNPLIVLVIMGIMGYRRSTGFLAGLTVAQISEFSLILVAAGMRVGHVDESVVGLVTLVGLITIGLSTYLILYSKQLLGMIHPYLRIFERSRSATAELHAPDEGDVDAIVYGAGRHGSLIIKSLQDSGWRVLVVDIDPDTLERCTREGFEVIYGDASDPEFIATLPLEQARWVVSTVPGLDMNMGLLHGLRAAGYGEKVALTAHTPIELVRLQEEEDVDLVIAPFAAAAERFVANVMENLATE